MRLEALELSIELVHTLRPLALKVQQHDSNLASQLWRAASSISLNLAEGGMRAGKDRLHHWRIAAGSAAETRAALRVAGAWGYVDLATSEPALRILDHLLGKIWGLTHPR